MTTVVRCRCCGAVRVYEGGAWTWRLPKEGEQWAGEATCGMCGPVLERERKQKRDRSERETERRIARGFGPGDGDAFEGFREG